MADHARHDVYATYEDFKFRLLSSSGSEWSLEHPEKADELCFIASSAGQATSKA
ncbi:hypothetical protein ACTXT7_008307 [Hymenolepis weldensis]